MRTINIIFLALFLTFACGCAARMEQRMCIDEFGNLEKVTKSLNKAKNPRSWGKLLEPAEAVFCETEKQACVIGKRYQITKYLPKKFLGYRYVIFKNEDSEEQLFLLDNLPFITDKARILTELKRIDP